MSLSSAFRLSIRHTLRIQQAPQRGAHRSAAPIMAAAAPAKYYVLQYSYVPDMMSKRDPYRQSHLDTIKTWEEKGKMVMAGALVDPLDGGILVFKDCTTEEVEEYARSDVYTTNNLVTEWKVRAYACVVGG